MENKIKAEIVAHSKRANTGEEIITYRLTFPRIILSEINTYKMMEKNTSSCLLGDTKISFYKEGLGFFTEKIEDIYETFNGNKGDFEDVRIVSLNEDTEDYILQRVSNVFYSGKKPVYEVRFENGYSITCTKEHKLNTTDGWKTLEDYGVNDKTKCDLLKKDILSMELLSFADKYLGKEFSPYSRLITPRISSIYYRGVQDVFDIEVDGKYHNFVANGFVVHNSRAIPVEKMLEVVAKNSFFPIAYQRQHKGMQGNEYFTDASDISICELMWSYARNSAYLAAQDMYKKGFTKQLINRIVEPYTWVMQLVTGTRESFEHLFEQRCPIYPGGCKSWKELCNLDSNYSMEASILERLQVNKGQAEIHFMDLAEKMYDVLNESKPQILNENEWHIPFSDRPEFTPEMTISDKLALSCAMTARVSYTTINEDGVLTLEKAKEMYEKLKNAGHWSCFGHTAQCMTDYEYETWIKGKNELSKELNTLAVPKSNQGYCKNLRGFIPLRQKVEEELEAKREDMEAR